MRRDWKRWTGASIAIALTGLVGGASFSAGGAVAAEGDTPADPFYQAVLDERPQWLASPDVTRWAEDGTEYFSLGPVTWWLDEGQVFFRHAPAVHQTVDGPVEAGEMTFVFRHGELVVLDDGALSPDGAPGPGLDAEVPRPKIVTWRFEGATVNNQDPGLARQTSSVHGPFGDLVCKPRAAWPPFHGNGDYEARHTNTRFEGENSYFAISGTAVKEYGYSATGIFFASCTAGLTASRLVAVGSALVYSLTFAPISGPMNGWTRVSGAAFGLMPTLGQQIHSTGTASFSGGSLTAGTLTLAGTGKVLGVNACVTKTNCLTAS